MSERNLPEWEQLLSAAAHLQELLPGATLVGGTAVAIFAQHRLSRDADHVLPDLRERFDDVLAQLESVAGWRTARVRRPVLILGSLDGIETGVRQMIREEPLETREVKIDNVRLIVPTEAEQALASLDELYPQPNGESALQQLQVQLSNPMPYDLEETNLSEYRNLHPNWHDWNRVKDICETIAVTLLQELN